MTPRTGRRPGPTDTREGILEAARTTFGEVGYERATIRAIAGAAGVDPALVLHYLGSKEALFVEAIRVPLNPAEEARRLLEAGLEGAGERAVRFFLSVWEQPPNRDALLAVLRGAMTNERAAAMLRGFIGAAVVGPLAEMIGGADAQLRVSLVGSHLFGLALIRYVLRVEPLASADPEAVVALVGPRIQWYLTGAAERGPATRRRGPRG